MLNNAHFHFSRPFGNWTKQRNSNPVLTTMLILGKTKQKSFPSWMFRRYIIFYFYPAISMQQDAQYGLWEIVSLLCRCMMLISTWRISTNWKVGETMFHIYKKKMQELYSFNLIICVSRIFPYFLMEPCSSFEIYILQFFNGCACILSWESPAICSWERNSPHKWFSSTRLVIREHWTIK